MTDLAGPYRITVFEGVYAGAFWKARRQARRGPVILACSAFGFHQVGEDVVDARQVTFALGFQPIENPRIETHTHRYLSSDVAQAHHARQLLSSQAGDVFEVNVRIVSSRLACGSAAERATFLFSPLPVPDIFGFHAFQPCGLR